MIHDLIKALTAEERKTIAQRVNENPSHLHKFIGAILDDPGISQAALESRFAINKNTYFKNVTLAKDEIYEVIKMHMPNSYDDILLTNVLYRRGLEVHASKLRLKLEEEYIQQGWWNPLQELYYAEMMVAYARCDVRWMERIKDKTLANTERIARFVKVDREVIVQMAVIEKGNLKESEFDAYARRVDALLRLARQEDHPTPVFNALHCLFLLYTNYNIDLPKGSAIVKDIHHFLDKYDNRVIPYVKNAGWLNTMGFYVQFAAGQEPQPYFEPVNAAIGSHGLLYDAQALIDFCTYYFYEKDKENFVLRFEQFLKLPAEKSFQYQTAFLQCLHAYMHHDTSVFGQARNDFYTFEKSRAYDDYDLTLRYLEMLLLLKDQNYSLVSDKLEATIKFIRRNFTSPRIKIENQNWNIFKSVLNKKPVSTTGKKVYRITDFILKEMP